MKGNSAAVPCAHPSAPLSWADICVGTGAASRLESWKTKRDENPSAWPRCPAAGAAQTQLHVPLLFPCCDKAARGGCTDPVPVAQANNNSEGLTCGGGQGGGSSGAGVGSSPPKDRQPLGK